MVGCGFIYLCWTSPACCSLLTWAETTWARQLINMEHSWAASVWWWQGLVGALANSEFPIARRIPQRQIVATLRIVSSFFEILWSLNVFLEDCEIFFNLAGGIYPETTHVSQDGSKGSGDLPPVYFGVQTLPSCVGFLELSWEILSPETWFWGCLLKWHSFIVLNRYLRFPRGSQVYWMSSSVFFHSLTHE